MLDPYLGPLTLNQINGDVIWSVVQGELKKGNKPATVNRYLALIRSLLRMARDEWQWIDSIPKIRLLPGEVERDRWLTREEAERLIQACPPHLAALVQFALATGCRAREITGLEWGRVDLARRTAWLNQTKNGTPRGVPLNKMMRWQYWKVKSGSMSGIASPIAASQSARWRNSLQCWANGSRHCSNAVHARQGSPDAG